MGGRLETCSADGAWPGRKASCNTMRMKDIQRKWEEFVERADRQKAIPSALQLTIWSTATRLATRLKILARSIHSSSDAIRSSKHSPATLRIEAGDQKRDGLVIPGKKAGDAGRVERYHTTSAW